MSAFKMTLRIIVGAALFFFGLLLLLGCAGIARAGLPAAARIVPGRGRQRADAESVLPRQADADADGGLHRVGRQRAQQPRARQPAGVAGSRQRAVGAHRLAHRSSAFRLPAAARHRPQPRAVRVGDVHQRPLGSDLLRDQLRHQADRAGRQAQRPGQDEGHTERQRRLRQRDVHGVGSPHERLLDQRDARADARHDDLERDEGRRRIRRRVCRGNDPSSSASRQPTRSAARNRRKAPRKRPSTSISTPSRTSTTS